MVYSLLESVEGPWHRHASEYEFSRRPYGSRHFSRFWIVATALSLTHVSSLGHRWLQFVCLREVGGVVDGKGSDFPFLVRCNSTASFACCLCQYQCQYGNDNNRTHFKCPLPKVHNQRMPFPQILEVHYPNDHGGNSH